MCATFSFCTDRQGHTEQMTTVDITGRPANIPLNFMCFGKQVEPFSVPKCSRDCLTKASAIPSDQAIPWVRKGFPSNEYLLLSFRMFIAKSLPSSCYVQAYGILHVKFASCLLQKMCCLVFWSKYQELIDVTPCVLASRGLEPIEETSVVTRLFRAHGCCENLRAVRVPYFWCAFGSRKG